ncbi:protein of unknown function DUF520 [Desulfurispirillum indicum S5]|uniref:Nucleotide-binding protein Selin_2395 n=1 Tax=Desulfurispirillum indicum (strain ATCC BAA-1389 / DSM 22839 / S5) TaxID=653733 RepID=E6W4N7_DESIS|nr:YajQ family cyclic di-GMP-binding protein [Desulfurispirillum indicum]ADU67110.1 protein of unknown function DUF520 [Desulfurispirillum indicum S5]
MPSFDIVSQVDLQEVDNAINMTSKLVESRYDFRGSKSEITLNKKDKAITILTEDDMKLRAIKDSIISNCIKRSVDPKVFAFDEAEKASGNMIRVHARIQEGIDKETAKKVVKMIKETGLKVQAAIQDEQVRVTAKKIDDLQEIIQVMKNANLDIPLQYVNMRS